MSGPAKTIWKRDDHGFHEKVGEFRDIYGRKIYYIAGRFPAYDYYDRRYDSRFYRDYYLHEKGKLFRISFPDGSKHFSVTEDVQEIKANHWEKLKQQQWILC